MVGTAYDGVLRLDEDGRIEALDPAAEALLDWSLDEVVGHDAHMLLHHGHHPGRRCPLAAEAGAVVNDVFLTRDGTPLPVLLSFVAAAARAGDASPRLLVFRDRRPDLQRRKLNRRKARDAEMERRIRRALDGDRMVLYAQPIVDCATREVRQHELLIRMREEDGRIVAPGDFLPAAERCGLIRAIDRWVIREASRLAAGGHSVELNLSAESLGDPTLLRFIEGVVDETGADPARMIIELTETAFLRDEDLGGAFIDGVRALGCRVALDDFGTGYGGLHYLKRFTLDYLKIDREFVRDLERDAASRHVVRAVANLAEAFGLRTIAEGVEDAATLGLLHEFGVHYAQGYHIRRPKPAARALGAVRTEEEEPDGR